ncbi:hypothetical protein Ahy_A04g021026 [Arachis hypogaea]|uniref:Uncharacterized protein n=1 Tax=Arachis hypogaea TaxID=3818 RepID=A0A445DJ51_ARAHY|nr:hypothetical protein Ahy_A04g021026 [Arachis hypogaea]
MTGSSPALSNDGVSATSPPQPFRSPRSEPRPEPRTANGVQVTEPCNEDIDPEANENLNNRPEEIFREYWRWFIDYRNDHATKAKCKQNALNQKKQFYTHTDGFKSLARARKDEEKISEIEQLDETTRILSENDSLTQAFGKERSEVTAEKLRKKAVEDEVAAEKLKRKAMEDEIAAQKMKRQALESVLSDVVQK